MRLFRLMNTIVANRRGGVPRPSWCTYLVCYRCNARCQMCDSWRLRPGAEMSPDQVRVAFGKVGRLDVVRLTGGEPFLRDDFAEVAEAVREQSRPAVLHITTNGSFPDRIAEFSEQFADPRRLRFLVSFDGNAERHDANRGWEVTFQKACESVERLVALRAKLRLDVAVNHTVISRESLRDHGELRARFEPRGVAVQSVLAYEDSSMYGLRRQGTKSNDLISGSGYPLHPRLDLGESIAFIEQRLAEVQAIRDRWLRRGKKYYLSGLLSRLRNDPQPAPQPRCVALRSHLRILPDGSVPVCQFNTERMGNLVTQSFDEVWHGETTRASRAWVDACPGCWAECEVIPSAIYTGDILLHPGTKRHPTP